MEAMRYIALARQIKLEHLAKVLGINVTPAMSVEKTLMKKVPELKYGYVRFDGGYASLRYDVFDEAIIWEGLNEEIDFEAWVEYLKSFDSYYVLGAALGLANLYSGAEIFVRNPENLREIVLQAAEELLEVADERYTTALIPLAFAGVPVSFDVEKLIKSAEADAEVLKRKLVTKGFKPEWITPDNVVMNVLSHLGVNALEHGVEPCYKDFAAVAERQKWIDPNAFLANIYSMIISRISHEKTPKEVKDWVDDIVERAKEELQDLGFFYYALLFHLRNSSYAWRKQAVLKGWVRRARDIKLKNMFIYITMRDALWHRDSDFNILVKEADELLLTQALLILCRDMVQNKELEEALREIADEDSMNALSEAASLDGKLWEEWWRRFIRGS